jgi:cytochrome oxidase Cu insertion factor (SCO1/SenC/PrrC family)
VKRRTVFLVVAAAATVGIASGVALAALRTSHPAASPSLPELHGQASWPAGRRLAPSTGMPSLRARVSVVTFMDPACTQICPVEGRELASILRRLPAAARPRIVLVSVNPEATAAQARRALVKWQLAPFDAHWVLGTHAQLARLWRAYDVVVRVTKGDIEHTPVAYLVDRSGHERTAYLFPFAPAFVQGDLARLARERT